MAHADCNRSTRAGRAMHAVRATAVTLLFASAAFAGLSGPGFNKVFSPDTIGPGSISTITFTITNDSGTPVTSLAFTDVLPTVPGDVDIADPANASTNCLDGIVTAPDGGGTITLSDGRLEAGASCTVTVDVTASTPGVHTNPAVTLTSSAGSSISPSTDLTVVTTLPGFSKSFAPSTVAFGGRSTLTFTIDNTANPSTVDNLDFTDNLPAGMVIAAPSSASTTCGTALIPPTLTAVAGTGVIILDANGIGSFPAVAAGASCTISVDVVSTGVGELHNLSGELLANFVSAGKASATLDVTRTNLSIRKSFTNDPVPPGGTATLELTIDNFDRNFSATGIAFSDDLTTLIPALAGLTFDSLLANDCGGSVAGVGGTTIGFSGGILAPEGSCEIRVSLSVPAGTTPGVYTNTTGAITATVDGSPVVGNMASDDLFAEPVPILTKEFLEVGTLAPDPVINPGDDVVIRFTITNPSTTSGATAITFVDELTNGGPGTGFLPFPVLIPSPTLPTAACGGTLSLVVVASGTERRGLSLTGGSLAAAPGPGDSCTFDVTVTVPATLKAGIYLNTTGQITATIDGATRRGDPASDTLTVIAAPTLTKAFTDDPVAPGGSVTLEFTLTHSLNASGDATAIAFTDDLAPVLTGLTATGLPLAQACDPDGPGGVPGTGTLSGSVGDTLLTFMGGTLAPGESCAVSVILDVPAGAAPGSYTNTTSAVTATQDGLAATSAPASDDLDVAALVFTKEFLTNPVIPGDTTTLRFTIENVHPTDDATITSFTDSLTGALTGLAATGAPSVNTCGGALSGTTSLLYVGGSVLSGQTCAIEVAVLVPAAAADGTYLNVTGSLSTSLGTIAPATDTLTVDSNLLQLTKEFTDDPVAPGETVSLKFTLTNLSATDAASGIAFSDDLNTALTGLQAIGATANGCGGMAGGFPTGLFSYGGGSLAAGASCMIVLDVVVPAGPLPGNVFTNTTSGVTGTINGLAVVGEPASDDLEVQLLKLGKSFDGPTTATGTAVLTFTIQNLDSVNPAGNLAFSDNLGAVIPSLVASGLPAAPCGAGSTLAGTSFLTLSNGSLPAGGMCSFPVTVTLPGSASAGGFLNTTSALFQSGLAVADPATALLTVEPPPTFAKLFAPDSIAEGNTSTLTFTIDNSASALAASALAFTDNLPAGITVATAPNASNACAGALTAVAGTSVITLSGGSVGAGASCQISVDVAGAPGMHVNTTGDLTSSSGNSGTASDTLTVLANTPTTTPTTTPTSTSTSTPTSTPTVTPTQTPTATLDPNSDTDMDGVTAGTEDGCPNGGDGNDDGVSDSTQPDVTSLPLPSGKCVTMVTSGGCSQNQNVETFSEAGIADDPLADYPLGLIGFMLPCETADVLLIFHGEDDPTGLFYRKFGPMAPVFGPPVFYNFPAVFGTTTVAGETAVTAMLSLTDGLLGDDTDGTDDLIVEPGGPATAVTMPAPAPVVSRLGLLAVLAALLAVAVCALARRRQPRRLTPH